jgi:hypothetical protein
MSLKIHAICLALNEEIFVSEVIRSLYPFCSGISVISQYDRDWYGKPIYPDQTASIVLNYPDPDGKIHFVVRRNIDEAATRNQEMLALQNYCARNITPHGNYSKKEVLKYHAAPDYFLIVDADEIYDIDTMGNIIDYLALKQPRGMRILGYNYVRTWNRRVPSEVVRFQHFGFIRPGILFDACRLVSLNEQRLIRLCSKLRLPNFASKLYGFIDCPEEVGFFHHACWIGDNERLRKKVTTSSHFQAWDNSFTDNFTEWVDSLNATFIPTDKLPRNIQEGNWADYFFEDNCQSSFSSEVSSHDLERLESKSFTDNSN